MSVLHEVLHIARDQRPELQWVQKMSVTRVRLLPCPPKLLFFILLESQINSWYLKKAFQALTEWPNTLKLRFYSQSRLVYLAFYSLLFAPLKCLRTSLEVDQTFEDSWDSCANVLSFNVTHSAPFVLYRQNLCGFFGTSFGHEMLKNKHKILTVKEHPGLFDLGQLAIT